jgi:hypothetical protein
VSPSQLTFTQINVPQPVTLTNHGSTPLAIGAILTTSPAIGNTTNAFYSETNNCGDTLAPQSICTIAVSATALDSRLTGTLTINDDAVAGPLSVSLHQTGTFTASPGSISFGKWAVGASSIPQDFFAARLTTAPQVGLSGITGPNASDFSVTGVSFCSDLECQIPVIFTPSALGTRTATLVTSVGNILLSGIGMPAGPNFTYLGPGSFAATLNINVGPYVSTLTNNGTTPLQIAATITGPTASDFTILNQCTSVPTSSSCSINFNFKPSQVGAFADLLTLTDTQSGLQQTYPFVSLGQPAPPSASPSSLAFGNVQVGATSNPRSFTVTAPPGDPVIATVLQFGQPNGQSGFAITQGAGCSSTPCTVTVVMAPNSIPCCAANLKVTDTVTQAAVFVSLAGTAGVPVTSFSPSGLSFSLRSVGTTSIAQTVTLTNTGNASLTITGISLVGADPGDFIQSNNCGTGLAVNGQCTFSISFAPTATGTRTAAIQTVSNASTSPDLIQLTGTAQ